MPRLMSLLLVVAALAAGGPAVALGAGAMPAASPSPVDDPLPHNVAIHDFPAGTEPEETPLGTLGDVIALQPGAIAVLALGVWDYERCGVGIQCFIPVDLDPVWSVEPVAGVTIDSQSGELVIGPDVPHGTSIPVRADLEGGRFTVSAVVHVYTLDANPLVGLWREEVRFSCDDGSDIVPGQPVLELVFAADGQFAVTWQPFESYVDYWGTYAFDLDPGTIELSVTSGNQVPDDIDGTGTFVIDEDGNLILHDLWLGTSQWEDEGVACGHRFSPVA